MEGATQYERPFRQWGVGMRASATVDVIILVSDKNMESAVQGVLTRPQALGIRNITSHIKRHSEKDSGCLTNGAAFLSNFTHQYKHTLLMFDHEGCGNEATPADEIESRLKSELANCGWSDRAEVIVIEPELDIWVWSESPHVDEILGWKDRTPRLRQWLQQEHAAYWPEGKKKPLRPKEALESALREVRKPRSSSLYISLAKKVSLDRCTDPSFIKFKTVLQRWFGIV
jgi:hypothetical protein